MFLPSSFAEEKVPERVEALRNAQANGRWLTDLDVFFQPEIRRNKIYRLERWPMKMAVKYGTFAKLRLVKCNMIIIIFWGQPKPKKKSKIMITIWRRKIYEPSLSMVTVFWQDPMYIWYHTLYWNLEMHSSIQMHDNKTSMRTLDWSPESPPLCCELPNIPSSQNFADWVKYRLRYKFLLL